MSASCQCVSPSWLSFRKTTERSIGIRRRFEIVSKDGGGKLNLFAAGAWHNSTTAISPNTWTHVAVTYDGSDKKFYLGGTLDNTAPHSGSIAQNSMNAYIGRQGQSTDAGHYDGRIDEVRIWNVVREQTEIQATMNSTLMGDETGLVGYWRFEQFQDLGAGAAGTNDIEDCSPNGNHGDAVNSPTLTTSNFSGLAPNYIARVNTGTGSGELGLILEDDDSITDEAGNPFGGVGEQDYSGGQSYTINRSGPPTVTTTAVSNIATTTADSGGNVTDDGGESVTARGVCWNTGGTPTTADSKTTDGTGTGVFTSSITPLTAGTTYYVRAYATNSVGTAYGNEVSFTTDTTPSVTTTAISNITGTTADSGGNVTTDGGDAVTARGVCWSTSANPTTADSKTGDGSGTGVFTSNITGLTAGTTYYVRAYATNSVGTAYGSEVSFTTDTTPTVTTTAISNITGTTADSGGNVTADGGDAVTARGVCWNTGGTPTTADSKTSDGTGTGVFTSNITGLTAGTTYYVRAYATNSVSTAYGSEVSFTSDSAPTVTTTAISNIGIQTADSGGNVTADGGDAVTARGVCWSTSTGPTTTDSKTTDGTGTGAFTSSITGLTAGTTYYVRAYATNSVGTSYGNELSFTTNTTTPTVTTTALSNITPTTAASGGNVTADGGDAVTARGVCWNTGGTPTTADSKTTDGTGTGAFTSSITGLTFGTTYYVRAYATNGVGTSYGSEVSFVADTSPTVTTTAISKITTTTADSGGNVTADGGDPVTARGVCWSTSTGPTTTDSKTTDGTGTGVFTSNISGLTGGTTYYVRAYATNAAGVSYGSEVSFTSSSVVPTVTTTAISNITGTTASSGGNVTADGGEAATARGVCWSTSANPTTADSKTTDGTGTGVFTSSITGLTANTTYYVAAYATNSVGTAYGSDVSFTTDTTATVTTTAISNITGTTAYSGGNVTADGGEAVTARGVCWSTSANPTTADSKTTDGTGTGVFTSSITGLTANTTYYVAAYATNSVGTAYGSDVSFTTDTTATVTTTAISNITGTTAYSGGNVTADGGEAVTARGVCWSTSANPTTADSKTTDGAGTGAFTSNITGLTANTTYYVAAYATNSVGTTYGSDVSFTTDTTATVTTTAISNIANTTADSGGNVTADGGEAITVRGVCWSTSANPTTADDKTSNGTGAGAFSSNITGLTASTAYYVAAYATNSVGTAYGDDVTFTTGAETGVLDLQVRIEAASEEASVGEDVAFDITVNNVGDGGATDVVLTFPLPENSEFVSARRIASQAGQAAPLTASVVGGNIVIEVGDVAAGEDVQIELMLRAVAVGTIELEGTAAANEAEAVPADETPSVVVGAAQCVDQNLLRLVLSLFFGAPICGLGAAGAVPLSLVGLVCMKMGLRRRRG